MPTYETRTEALRIVIDFGPQWESMARTLGKHAIPLTFEHVRKFARRIAEVMIEEMRKILAPHHLTGRLSAALRYWVGPGFSRPATPGMPGIPAESYFTIGINPAVPGVVTTIGKHPRQYATPLELGGSPGSGKGPSRAMRGRIDSWAGIKGLTPRGGGTFRGMVKAIAWMLYIRGSAPHAFMFPGVWFGTSYANRLAASVAQEIVDAIVREV